MEEGEFFLGLTPMVRAHARLRLFLAFYQKFSPSYLRLKLLRKAAHGPIKPSKFAE
jgi:hypothetical protein